MTTRTSTWPKGVIARYLTVGGATVDLTDDRHRDYIGAVCTGERCGWRDQTRLGDSIYDMPQESQERFDRWLPTAQREAQEHAERCRAMPKPDRA